MIDQNLVDLPLHKLDERDLHRWRESLPERLAASTVRRAINDFKAALNSAARRYRAQLPAHIPIVIRNGLASVESVSPVARAAQMLPDSDIRRLISAAKEFDAEDD